MKETTYDKLVRLEKDDCKEFFQGITVNDNGYTLLLGVPNKITVRDLTYMPKTKNDIVRSKRVVNPKHAMIYDRHYKYNRTSVANLFKKREHKDLHNKVLLELHIDNLDRIGIRSTEFKENNISIHVISIDNKPSLIYTNGDVVLISEEVRTSVLDNSINIFNTTSIVLDIAVEPAFDNDYELLILFDCAIFLAHDNLIYVVDRYHDKMRINKKNIMDIDKDAYVKRVYAKLEDKRVNYALELFDINIFKK